MAFPTALLADYNAYFEAEFPVAKDGMVEARVEEEQERRICLAQFPHAILLQLSVSELDFANRWCWEQFGPAQGECCGMHSQYPACHLQGAHSHDGKWMTRWLVKTSYDYGFNEWYFARFPDKVRFLEFVHALDNRYGSLLVDAHDITSLPELASRVFKLFGLTDTEERHCSNHPRYDHSFVGYARDATFVISDFNDASKQIGYRFLLRFDLPQADHEAQGRHEVAMKLEGVAATLAYAGLKALIPLGEWTWPNWDGNGQEYLPKI
jgi:hypothetical protein